MIRSDLMGTDYKQHFNLTCNVKQLSYSQYNMRKWMCNLYDLLYIYILFFFLFFFVVDTPTRTTPEREIISVTLKKDPKLGFGE